MIKQKIENLIKQAFVKTGFAESNLKIDIKESVREDFGDFSAIISGNLESEKGKEFEIEIVLGKNPAEKIASNIPASEIFNIEFKPPRFFNFFFTKKFLFENLNKIIKEKENFGKSKIGHGRTAVIDYSSLNIAKSFGVGHLRSTIIGQAIYNLYQCLGYKCVGDNHLGDWGTQFGKLIFQIELKIKNEKLKINELTIKDLEKLYVEFHQKVKENQQMEAEAREWFKKLEQGDKEARKIWHACVKISLKEFGRIYKLLDVKIDYALGESFYQEKMQEIVEELKKKGIARKSEGALVIKFENNILPILVVVKLDGATTYFLRDLATMKYRLKKWKPDLIIYEVGVDQSLHFQQLFKTVELLGWVENVELKHLGHGLLRSEQGKFSTRQGKTIHLEEVLTQAISKARGLIEKSETARKFSNKEKNILSQQIGIGAIKYNDLSQDPRRDIIFDWDKILNLKGNSGPYLQYTFVRTQSVFKKSPLALKKDISGFLKERKDLHLNEIESKILRMAVKFEEVIKESAKRFAPYLVCGYLFKLSQQYNLFYDTCPILRAETKELKAIRLGLTLAVGYILKNGLSLLGIEAPERM